MLNSYQMADKKYPDHIKQEITALLAEGYTPAALERKYGIPATTLRHFPITIARKAKHEKELQTAIDKLQSTTYHSTFVQDAPSPKKEGVSVTTEKSFRIGVLPDCQVKPGVDISHLPKIGQYFADKRPDVIVCIGDFADMPSLSSHEAAGSLKTENQRYQLDIQSVQEAMQALMTPIQEVIRTTDWKPRLVMTMGNHEHRITRALEAFPKLLGTIQLEDLRYTDWGWEVYPFLEPVVIKGIAFCHYFQTGQMGRPASSARAILNKQHMSCFAGHQQGRDIAYGKRGDGREMTAIICGSAYLHDEDYLSHQTNNHFRGIYMLNDVEDGQFEEMPVSLKYLMRRH